MSIKKCFIIFDNFVYSSGIYIIYKVVYRYTCILDSFIFIYSFIHSYSLYAFLSIIHSLIYLIICTFISIVCMYMYNICIIICTVVYYRVIFTGVVKIEIDIDIIPYFVL